MGSISDGSTPWTTRGQTNDRPTISKYTANIMSQSGSIHPIASPATESIERRLFVRDLMISCAIGVHDHEKDGPQNVRVNVDLLIAEPNAPHHDRIGEVVSYDDIVSGIRTLVGTGHINLAETLAERIADLCLGDRRVARATVRVEKLEVLSEAESVGVEIIRQYVE